MSRFNRRGRPRSREEVRGIAAAYRRSGMSAARFAAERAIPLSTLYSYLRGDSGHRRRAQSRLIAVRLRSDAVVERASEASAATVAIELPGPVTLRVPADTRPERLAELLEVLR
jgi:hypothetical protein